MKTNGFFTSIKNKNLKIKNSLHVCNYDEYFNILYSLLTNQNENTAHLVLTHPNNEWKPEQCLFFGLPDIQQTFCDYWLAVNHQLWSLFLAIFAVIPPCRRTSQNCELWLAILYVLILNRVGYHRKTNLKKV